MNGKIKKQPRKLITNLVKRAGIITLVLGRIWAKANLQKTFSVQNYPLVHVQIIYNISISPPSSSPLLKKDWRVNVIINLVVNPSMNKN